MGLVDRSGFPNRVDNKVKANPERDENINKRRIEIHF